MHEAPIVGPPLARVATQWSENVMIPAKFVMLKETRVEPFRVAMIQTVSPSLGLREAQRLPIAFETTSMHPHGGVGSPGTTVITPVTEHVDWVFDLRLVD